MLFGGGANPQNTFLKIERIVRRPSEGFTPSENIFAPVLMPKRFAVSRAMAWCRQYYAACTLSMFCMSRPIWIKNCGSKEGLIPTYSKPRLVGCILYQTFFGGVSLQILAICTRLCSAVQRNLEEDKSQYLQDLTAICAAINEKLSVKVHQIAICALWFLSKIQFLFWVLYKIFD